MILVCQILQRKGLAKRTVQVIHDILDRQKRQLVGRNKQIRPHVVDISQDQGHQRFHARIGKTAALLLYVHQYGKIVVKPGFEIADLYGIRKLVSVKTKYGQQKHIVVKGFQLGNWHQQIVSLIRQLKRPGSMLVKWVEKDEGARPTFIISASDSNSS